MAAQTPSIETYVVFDRKYGAMLTDLKIDLWEQHASNLADAQKLHLTYTKLQGRKRSIGYDLTIKNGCFSSDYRFHTKADVENVDEEVSSITAALNQSLKKAMASSRYVKNQITAVKYQTSDNWLADNRLVDTRQSERHHLLQ